MRFGVFILLQEPSNRELNKSMSSSLGRPSAPRQRAGPGASHIGVKQPNALRTLNSVTVKRLSRSEGQLTPSWDPVKVKSGESIVDSPLWKGGVSKSMRRAIESGSAHGALVRPSVMIAQVPSRVAVSV